MSIIPPLTALFGRVFPPTFVPASSTETAKLAQRNLEYALDEYVEGAFATQPLLRMLGNVGVPEWVEPDPYWVELDAREYHVRRNQREVALAFVKQVNAILPTILPRVRNEIHDAADKTAQSPSSAVRLHNIAERLQPYTPDAIDARFGKLSGPIKNAMLTSPDWVAEESREVGRRIHRRVAEVREQVRQNGIVGLESPWQWVELAAYLNMLCWNPPTPAASVFRADLEDLQRWVRVPEYMINGTFEYVPGKK